jgi:hypothetical protein
MHTVFVFVLSVFLQFPVFFHMPIEDKPVLTPLGEKQLMNVLKHTHQEVFDRPASRERLAMAWAQVALENGRGKLTLNHNLGNVGAIKNQRYYRKGPARFRSFSAFHEGGRAYWNVLKNNCAGALQTFRSMDPMLTAKKLRRCGYHRTEVELYGKVLHGLMWTGHKLASES